MKRWINRLWSGILSLFTRRPPSEEAARIALPNWSVIGETVAGASHLRAGKENQDAIGFHSGSRQGLPLVLAVSDGHGSSVRAHDGARLAVKTALEVLIAFTGRGFQNLSPSAARQTVRERLPRELVDQWRVSVREHLERKPFTEEELHSLGVTNDPQARAQLDEGVVLLAYGTTILAAFVVGPLADTAEELRYAYGYLQLGDGDILAVSDSGQVTRPLPRDPRLLADQTTSLSTDHAWSDFAADLFVSSRTPVLILVSSDGYANSFRDEAGFTQVGSDLWELIATDGLEEVEASLRSWLEEATLSGSGDDITLGIIYRGDARGT